MIEREFDCMFHDAGIPDAPCNCPDGKVRYGYHEIVKGMEAHGMLANREALVALMAEHPADNGLPEPECQMGYTEAQLALIFDFGLGAFQRWMRGQTFAVCDGRRYDYDRREYEPTGCGPHGMVFYAHDVRRFLAGGEPLD